MSNASVIFDGNPTPQAEWDAGDFWIPMVVVFCANWIFGIWCQVVKDNSWIDAYWGISFVLPNAALLIKRLVQAKKTPDIRCWIVFALITIWALRLFIHIVMRHKGEDFRYQDMRRDWTAKGGKSGYLWRTFLFIFTMQGLFSIIVNSAALYVQIFSKSDYLIWLDFLGIAIWLFGFLFETIGDEQLKAHIKDKTPGKPKFIFSGLWRFTRHPNYFGEAVLWWGVYLVASAVEVGWATFFAPLFISILVRFVSGVPMLEAKYKGNPEWEEYCRRVNVFFPLPTRKSKPALAEQRDEL